MNVRHDDAGHVDEQATGTHSRGPQPLDGPAPEAARAVVHGADPRLVHAGGAEPGLMHLQRVAGNAAVASLVASRLAVQRVVGVDEVAAEAATTEPTAPAAAASGGAAPGPGGAVTSDGANTTISGATITLAAASTTANGILRADTIIADSVIASNYTPGAGNVW